jgi:asparagine synthase (glutamine-hydrolysing)
MDHKILIKEICGRIVPAEIIYRKKKGFPVPINAWFKGDFTEKAANVLLDTKSINRGYFNKDSISRVIQDHRDGKDDFSRVLFSLVVLETWHRVFIDNNAELNLA